jgi:cell wall assembly regulator SMI1
VWPDELVELYRCVDGSERSVKATVLPFHRITRLEELNRDQELQLEIWAELCSDGQDPWPWDAVASPSATPDCDPYDLARLDSDPAGSESGIFLQAYLPFGEDTMGDHYFVDSRSGPLHGCVRLWGRDYGDEGEIRFTSVAVMLGAVADALETGGSADGWSPTIDDDCLRWRPAP